MSFERQKPSRWHYVGGLALIIGGVVLGLLEQDKGYAVAGGFSGLAWILWRMGLTTPTAKDFRGY